MRYATGGLLQPRSPHDDSVPVWRDGGCYVPDREVRALDGKSLKQISDDFASEDS